MPLLLLLVAFLLPPGAGAGEIIGGQEARPHSHPYMAFLQIQSQEGLKTCGGFLVRNDFVLTAAHCWGSTITVILGAHNIRRQERTQQRTKMRRAIRHPGYNPQTNRNDIMLLKLARPMRRTSAVRPVALPRGRARVRPGARCTVAGWGLLGLNKRTNRLHQVQLTVQSDSRCSNRFGFYNSQTQICVGDPRKRKSAFLGDSGGPLVCNGVAQGIVSYGDRRGIPPAVFTKIRSFMPWVNRTMRRFKQPFET
ncbi:cathepsin G-like [Neomonachus schauinslandi]|uniref:Cathepsin G-like n=1 Tax=Neomonachus schauinslandi TaxID=29088 RepID=A0A2Y9HNZ3_NEOSC|nr:cathepsin G-like [Neomonachus schauinslandi]